MEENDEDEVFAKYYAAKKQFKKVKRVSFKVFFFK